jgi:[ribosomal protein S18]-alanine N-acetyltransferase
VEVNLRQFRDEDLERLWRLDQACFPPGIAYSKAELAAYIRSNQSFTLAAELRGDDSGSSSTSGDKHEAAEIIGFIVAEISRRGLGHIITIDVSAAARRFGVGSKLLLAAEEQLRLGECRAVRLETAVDNLAALAFYKRHGYDILKAVPRYYSNGVDAVVLQKNLLSDARSS